MGNVIIAAVSLNNVIGLNNKLPWRVPSELSYFKKTTLDKMIVMGRKTFDGIGLLPKRISVILTQSIPYDKFYLDKEGKNLLSDIKYLPDLKQTLQYTGDCYIIGGEQIYDLFLRQTSEETKISKILLSRIPQECEGDAYFPKIPHNFKLVSIIEKEGFSVEEYINEEN